MMDQFVKFLQEDLTTVLDKLQEDTKPLWGILRAQHMMEHVVGSWRVSNGNATAKLAVTPEDLEENREFLFGERDFKPNAVNPIMPKNDLWPLRKKNLAEAKEQLLKEIADFFTYFDAHPDARTVHPLFGALDKEGWLIFQRKHMQHHFRQFGMIEATRKL